MFEKILLEPEQKELLSELVEMVRSVPKDKREKFLVLRTENETILKHPAIKKGKLVYFGDIEILSQKGLLHLTYSPDGIDTLNVTPEGFHYYGELKEKSGETIKRIEEHVTKFFKGNHLESKYPKSFAKISEAEAKLWKSDSREQLTTIGHLCREGIQEFTEEIFQSNQITSDTPKTHTKQRIQEIIDHIKPKIGTTKKPFLEALIVYWHCLNDLIQRQEHGAHKEGEDLVWEDARMVVFHTVLVMYEIDRAI